jgi:hypothetical protein
MIQVISFFFFLLFRRGICRSQLHGLLHALTRRFVLPLVVLRETALVRLPGLTNLFAISRQQNKSPAFQVGRQLESERRTLSQSGKMMSLVFLAR